MPPTYCGKCARFTISMDGVFKQSFAASQGKPVTFSPSVFASADLLRLLGSPMWLLALYSPSYSSSFAEASRYFIPPLWYTIANTSWSGLFAYTSSGSLQGLLPWKCPLSSSHALWLSRVASCKMRHYNRSLSGTATRDPELQLTHAQHPFQGLTTTGYHLPVHPQHHSETSFTQCKRLTKPSPPTSPPYSASPP